MARKRRKTEPDKIGGGIREGYQAGDLQGLSEDPSADSQSVRELAAEGQTFEASVGSAIENAPPPDAAEVTTHEVPEDDVPPEYRDRQRDELCFRPTLTHPLRYYLIRSERRPPAVPAGAPGASDAPGRTRSTDRPR